MYCPECKSEFEPHVTWCGACDVQLVVNLPDEERAEFQATVKIFESGNQGELAIAESLLHSKGIPYDVQNALVQNWIGAGAVGTGFNIVLGPPQIVVPVEYAEAAMKVLTPPASPVDLEKFYEQEIATNAKDK